MNRAHNCSITPHWYLLYIIFVSFLPLSDTQAHKWNNFVTNFNRTSYGRGTHTWDIATYDSEWTFFANQNGLLQYHGHEWTIYPLGYKAGGRSVCPSKQNKRVYVGGINEFGYMEPSVNGELQYISMSDSLPEEQYKIGNIWGIHEAENALYLQGDSKVLKKVNENYALIDAKHKIDYSALIDDVLYLGTSQGIMMVVGNTLFLLPGSEQLAGKRIRGFIPIDGGIAVATAYHGLFFIKEGLIAPYLPEHMAVLSTAEVFCTTYSERYIALGTVQDGVMLIERATGHLEFVNQNNSLQNSTVLSLAFDPQGNLWVGLDGGIDYVHLNTLFTNLYSPSFFSGTGYDALLHDNILYLGTNRGLYCTPFPVPFKQGLPSMKFIPDSGGQVWSLCKIDNELFCAHDRGLYVINGVKLTKIDGLAGVWNCKRVAGGNQLMFAGLYNGLALLRKESGKWILSHYINNIDDSFRTFEQESAHILWNSDQGICTRIELDESLTTVVKKRTFGIADGLPSERILGVSSLNGQVLFLTTDGFYAYDNTSQKMYLVRTMQNSPLSVAVHAGIIAELYHDGILVSCADSELFLPFPGIELTEDAERVVFLSDSSLILPYEKGVALINLAPTFSQENIPSASLRAVFISDIKKDSLLYLANFANEKRKPVIPSRYSIRFEYDVHLNHQRDYVFQYRLNNQEWSAPTKSLVKEYGNLTQGIYTFQVRAMLAGKTLEPVSFTFQILPPWYKTYWAYLCYFILFCAICCILYRWDETRLNIKKAQAVKEKDKELQRKTETFERENARKEALIVQLEKDKLEHELRYKSQEMANLMLNIARKNEILSEIKSALQKVVAEGNNAREMKQRLTIVNSKIDSNIKSDDVLKRIENEFDLVHNNFMARLNKKHPDLSFNERVMCMYIKMGLSTKEIAPLLCLSTRGVETLRYRLRKKMLLDREDGLLEYLNNFFAPIE